MNLTKLEARLKLLEKRVAQDAYVPMIIKHDDEPATPEELMLGVMRIRHIGNEPAIRSSITITPPHDVETAPRRANSPEPDLSGRTDKSPEPARIDPERVWRMEGPVNV
jgi:hypothetical protein